MNRRKLLSRREEYLRIIEDSPEQERSSSHFYSLLRSYYKRKWNVNLQLPRVNGVEVNLYKLYTAVKALGGWFRVTNTDKWYDVARDVLGLGDETTSADYCARLLYMRYLAKYEQFEQGSDTDDHDSEMMGSRNRGRGYSLYVTSECPIPYPKREQPDDQLQYERIIKSLASGLPNEVDFALNTCAIMSAPGPFVFNLDRHSALINLIISQAAVFDDNSDVLQEDFLRTQKRTTKRDFGHFWSTAGIQDADLLKIFSLVKPNKYSKLDYELFPLLKDEGHDPKKVEIVEYRVHQVLDIIRNLAFDTHNQPFLANNWACLKFLVICAATEINELRTNALDALSELASQICLSTDTLTTVLLRLLRTFIFSDDRILVMRSAEVIGGLCVNTENESAMSEFLEADILKRLFEMISAKDVLICVNTLDSLYNISEAGRAFCERLAAVPRGIELLVNFCTIEASQFTTNGLYGIKVTDRHNGNDHAPMRPSTSYYHAQHSMQGRTLPQPLQPLPMSAIQNRPHVVVSSKGDIAAVGTNKQPMLAAQLARPVIPVMQSGQEVLKREASVLNGSQVKQIRIVNGNGEPVVVQQATTNVIESTQTTVIKTETQEPVVSNNTIEDDDEEKMEIDESADQSTSNADTTQEDQQVESIVEVETTIIEEKTELIIDVPAEESTAAPKSSSTNSSESADVVNDETENEKKPAKKTVPNGANHSDEHPLLNGVNKEDNHKLPNKNGTAEDEITEENEDAAENGPVLNGTPSNKHIKENGCIKSKKNNEEEKPLLNGSIKSKKSKAKKRPVEADSNGSPTAKKTKKSPAGEEESAKEWLH
ncbi:ARID domain-containing protein C08B11.3 [Aphelenchoides bicaudatus]|nr:ARID domain-containing protein C08B11.3 [Aphelenchoides bicaudatus]